VGGVSSAPKLQGGWGSEGGACAPCTCNIFVCSRADEACECAPPGAFTFGGECFIFGRGAVHLLGTSFVRHSGSSCAGGGVGPV